MINYGNLEKIGEYKNRKLSIWFKSIYGKQESCVYLLNFEGDTYIGSTANLKQRVYNHVSKLSKHEHTSPLLQDAFDNKGEFEIFLLMRVKADVINNVKMVENGFINLLSPCLNSITPYKSSSPFTDFLWSFVRS